MLSTGTEVILYLFQDQTREPHHWALMSAINLHGTITQDSTSQVVTNPVYLSKYNRNMCIICL